MSQNDTLAEVRNVEFINLDVTSSNNITWQKCPSSICLDKSKKWKVTEDDKHYYINEVTDSELKEESILNDDLFKI